MSVLYQSDFETDGIGSLPAGWTADVGTWSVSTSNPTTGTRCLAPTSAANNNRIRRSGNAAQGYTKFQIDYKNLGTQQGMCPMARLTSDGTTGGYLFNVLQNDQNYYGIVFFRMDNGSFIQLDDGSAQVNPGAAIGDIVHVEILCNGSTLEGRVWTNGNARPSSPSLSVTDSTYATGQVGVRMGSAINRGVQGFDNPLLQDAGLSVSGTAPAGNIGTPYSVTFTAAGGTAPYTFSVGSGTLPPGLSLSTSGVLSGTPTTAGSSTFVVHAVDSTP